jgi:hypothetical protein
MDILLDCDKNVAELTRLCRCAGRIQKENAMRRRTIKGEIKVRPIWHKIPQRVEAHIMIAFLGYAMHVCLKKLAAAKAPSLTPWQILQHLRKIVMVDVEFETRDARTLTIPRITIPEQEQAAILLQLGWTLPQQPPPRIRSRQIPVPA